MSYDDAFLDRAHRFCTRNFEDAKRSQSCGCFSCLAVFPGHEVTDSYPEVPGYYADVDGEPRTDTETADCPRCNLDAVLPGNSGLPITEEMFLQAMQSRWLWQIKDRHSNA